MSTLVIAARTRVGTSAGLQLALLSASSLILGLVFIALLVADEAKAVTF